MTYSPESSTASQYNDQAPQLESKIQQLVASCDTNAIFGTIEERVGFATEVVNLEDEITQGQDSYLSAETYVRHLRREVARKIGSITEQLISDQKVTQDTLDALSALPVPAPALEKQIDKFYAMAIDAHGKAAKASSVNERNAKLQTAEVVTMVAVTFGRDIPEIKNGRSVVAQSGEAIHAHQVKTVVNEAKSNSAKKPVVNSFLEMAYAHQIPDENSLIKKMGLTAAAATVTGLLLSAAPVGAAHADAKIEKIETKASPKEIKPEQTVVLPAAAPGPEKDKPAESTPTAQAKDTKTETPVPTPPTAAVAPKTEIPKVSTDKQSPQPNQEAKPVESSAIKMKLPTQPTETPAPAVKDEIKSAPASPSANGEQSKDTKSDIPKEAAVPAVENPTGNKSTHEQTTPKDPGVKEDSSPHDQQSPSAEPKSDPIKIKLPDANNKPDSEDKAPSTTDDTKPGKDDTVPKIIDHLKEGPIKMKLPSVNKDEDVEKDTHKDEPNVETIGQPEGHPDTKKDLNKEIGKVIMGNGPIKMSLKDVEKKTKERKDEDEEEGGYKPRFKFAPSAELPPEPKITAETYRGAPIAEHIVDAGMAGETLWSSQTLEFIRDNLEMYTNVEKQTGVEWEIIAALHYREASMGMANPANGQGVFQLYSSGAFFKPGPVTKEEFTRQAVLAANLMKEKAKGGAVQGELSLSNPDKVKDTLFSYNGRAAQYGQQAKALGYNLPAEGSPYVMNLADDARNSNKNSNWGQILTDNGPLGKANQAPGAWVLIEGLIHIEKKAHDQAVAKQQAEAQEFEAKKAAEAKAAADAAEAERKARSDSEVEQFAGWHNPVPAGIPITSQFGVRGYDAQGKPIMHTGADFGAGMGTPYFAAAGGVVSVTVSGDVRSQGWCQAAISGIENGSMAQITDPYQKEVHVTTKIGDDTYVTVYAHMSEVSVAPGQIVKAGQSLGKTGNSGCSLGPHAHFEVRKNGTAIDPNTILGGAINASSSDIKVIDDGHSHDDHEHNSAETVSSGVGAAGPSDEQKTRLEAIKKVAELKRRMAEKNKSSEGYLAIR